METSAKAARTNVTMDEGLVARLDSLAAASYASRSALLGRGARMVLAAEMVEYSTISALSNIQGPANSSANSASPVVSTPWPIGNRSAPG